MAYDKITTEYMVHKTGEQWFFPVNSDGTEVEKVAECARLSPNGVEAITVAPILKPTIGTVTINGTTDVETGSATELSCTFSGDAPDVTYRWSTNSSNIAIVGSKTGMTVQVSGVSATGGNCWLLCAVSSPTASDGSATGQTKITVTDPPAPAKTVVKTVRK